MAAIAASTSPTKAAMMKPVIHELVPPLMEEVLPGMLERIMQQYMKSVDDKLEHLNIATNQQKVEMGLLSSTLEQMRASTGQVFEDNLKKAEHYISTLTRHAAEADQKIAECQARSDTIISGVNVKLAELEEAKAEMRKRIEADRAEMMTQISTEFADVQSKIIRVGEWKLEVDNKMATADGEIEKRCEVSFSNFESRVAAEIMSTKEFLRQTEERIKSTGVVGGAGTGNAGKGKGGLTVKDLKVDKLGEKVDVSDFRHWMKLVELQLDHVYGYAHMEDVVDELRRTREPVNVEG